MGSATIQLTNAAVLRNAIGSSVADNTFGGSHSQQENSYYAEYVIDIAGASSATFGTIDGFGGPANMEVWCNGVLQSPTYLNNGAINQITIPGVTNAALAYTLRFKSKTPSVQWWLNTPNFLVLTGPGTPTVAAPGASSTPPYGTIRKVADSTVTACTSWTSDWNSRDSEKVSLGHLSTYARLQFRSSATSLAFLVLSKAGTTLTFALERDGVVIATVTPPAFDYIAFTGLSGRHVYRLKQVTTDASTPITVSLINAVGDLDTAYSSPAVDEWLLLGDSITQGWDASNQDPPHDGYPQLTAEHFRVTYILSGHPGEKVSTFLRDQAASDVSAYPKLTKALLLAGTNDAGVTVTATFQADFQTMLTALTGASNITKVYNVSLLPMLADGWLGPDRTALNGAQAAAIAANGSSKIVNINSDRFNLVRSDFTGSNTVHPTTAGHAKIAAALERILAGTGGGGMIAALGLGIDV